MRTAARIITIAGVLLAVIAVRVVTASRAEVARGEAAERHGNTAAAIVAYRRAARWYAPGNPFVVTALDRLERIATDAEAADDPETAVLAWRSSRNAILAARSLYVPHAERRARAEEAIVRLTTAAAHAPGRTQARERIEQAFARPIGPSNAWTIVLLIGWLAWTGGAFAFAQLAIDEEDRIQSAWARGLGTVVVIGFGLFAIGMALA